MKGKAENSGKKTVSDYPTTEANPFIPLAGDLVRVWKFRLAKGKKKFGNIKFSSTDSGEMFDGEMTVLDGWNVSDRESFVKVFKSGETGLKELKIVGFKMFCFLLHCIQKEKDVVYLPVDGFLLYSGYENRKSYYEGILELLKIGFIARSVREQDYFVNPKMLFNGRRFKLKEIDSMIKELIQIRTEHDGQRG